MEKYTHPDIHDPIGNRKRKLALLNEMETLLDKACSELHHNDREKVFHYIESIHSVMIRIDRLDKSFKSPKIQNKDMIVPIENRIKEKLNRIRKDHETLQSRLTGIFEEKKVELEKVNKKKEQLKLQKKVLNRYYPSNNHSAFFDNKS